MPVAPEFGAEVGLAHLRMAAHFGGRAAGDDLAEVEDGEWLEMSITMPMSCSTSTPWTPHSSCTSRM
jgi:hypothetical protein